MNTLKTVDALIVTVKNTLSTKQMILTLTNDEASITLLKSSIATDELHLTHYELLKQMASGHKVASTVGAVEAPKRKVSPAQQQWLDEVSAVLKQYPDMSIEEARHEASRRREEGYSETEDDEEYDEMDEMDDEDYVEEKRPQSFLQKKWNKEVAAIMEEHPEWSVKEASKEASARRNGFSSVPAPNWVDIVTGHVASN